VIYGVFLVTSISFVDHHTPLDDRILVPLYLTAVLLLCCAGYDLITRLHYIPAYSVLGVLGCTLFLGFHGWRAEKWIADQAHNGAGYASRAWRQSALIDYITHLTRDVPIYSNAPDAVYILTGRETRMLPLKTNPNSNRPNAGYRQAIETMTQSGEYDPGIIVYFDTVSRWYLPSEDELQDLLPLRPLTHVVDGTVYRIEERY